MINSIDTSSTKFLNQSGECGKTRLKNRATLFLCLNIGSSLLLQGIRDRQAKIGQRIGQNIDADPIGENRYAGTDRSPPFGVYFLQKLHRRRRQREF
jgi:hypothetical protein